jgi:hydrogenase maturation protease
MIDPASKVHDPIPKTLILGLGNPILTDDGVGIHIVRQMAIDCQRDDLDFAEASLGGLRLLDLIVGYDQVIMADAIQTRNSKPGDVYRLHASDLEKSLHSGSTHDLSLPDALVLGRSLGMALPKDESIILIAVEIEDVLTFGETCTPAVTAAIPRAKETVLSELNTQQ